MINDATKTNLPTNRVYAMLLPTAIIATLAMLNDARAGVPQPDAVLYGNVAIDGMPVTAGADVTIIGRVDGIADPVAIYRMGQSSTAGDNYVLRIPLEAPVAGNPVGSNAAEVGQTVHIFIKSADGSEQHTADFTITAIGTHQQLHLGGECDTVRPSLVHATDRAAFTSPCSGYIDPRIESDNGIDVNLGVSQITMVFDERIKDRQNPDLTTAAFSVRQTGGGTPPTVQNINATMQGTLQVVVVTLSRPITVQEWTTIEVDAEDLCANPINSFGSGEVGDLGPSTDEPDRVDIAFLPGNVDQNSDTGPFDLLAFRVGVTAGTLPASACSEDPNDYLDINRSGSPDPFDLLDFRRIANGVPPATRAWNGQSMNNPRP